MDGPRAKTETMYSSSESVKDIQCAGNDRRHEVGHNDEPEGLRGSGTQVEWRLLRGTGSKP